MIRLSTVCLIAISISSSAYCQSNETAVATMTATFDCRRIGHDCYMPGGLCDIDRGVCVCYENYAGFDCSFELSTVLDFASCNNGEGCGPDLQSVCLPQDNGQPKCKCSYSTYGENCTQSRYELKCTEDYMTITAVPFSTDDDFQGSVFLINSSSNARLDDADCSFTSLNEGELQLKVALESVADKCGGDKIDNETHSLKFVVQSDADWLTSFDQIVNAKCSVSTSKEFQKTIIVQAGGRASIDDSSKSLAAVEVSNVLSNIAVNEIRAERRRIEHMTDIPRPVLTLGVRNQSRIEPITGPVKVGDIVSFTITNENNTFYTALRAEDCLMGMDNTMEAKLIENACPYSRLAWSLLLWQQTEIDNTSISFFMRLPGNALGGYPRKITISCRVKMCADDMVSECSTEDYSQCRNKTSGFLPSAYEVSNYGKRRKREVEIEVIEEPHLAFAYVSGTFSVAPDDKESFASSHVRRNTSRATSVQHSSVLSLLVVIVVLSLSAVFSSQL